MDIFLALFSILCSGVLSVIVLYFLSKKNQEKFEKLEIFKTLVKTRTNTLSKEHIDALNSIDVVFYKNPVVIDAWHNYFDSLSYIADNTNSHSIIYTRVENLIILLVEMGKVLNYKFTMTDLKKFVYYPNYQERLNRENNDIRQGIINYLKREKLLPEYIEKEVVKDKKES